MPIEGYDSMIGWRIYPGMTPPESEIVRRWLRKHRDDFDHVEFNVRLGDGADAPSDFDDSARAMVKANSQKRADMVAWRGLDPTMVEIKQRISFSAMGQLLGYRHLWQSTYPARRVPALIAVGESALHELADAFAAHGVGLELVD